MCSFLYSQVIIGTCTQNNTINVFNGFNANVKSISANETKISAQMKMGFSAQFIPGNFFLNSANDIRPSEYKQIELGMWDYLNMKNGAHIQNV